MENRNKSPDCTAILSPFGCTGVRQADFTWIQSQLQYSHLVPAGFGACKRAQCRNKSNLCFSRLNSHVTIGRPCCGSTNTYARHPESRHNRCRAVAHETHHSARIAPACLVKSSFDEAHNVGISQSPAASPQPHLILPSHTNSRFRTSDT